MKFEALRETRLDRAADEPLWRQLASALRNAIKDGLFLPDAALPSESELIDLYGVSRTVVREALAELARERIVYKIRAKGTFVSPVPSVLRFIGGIEGSAEDLRESGLSVSTSILDKHVGPATSAESEALHISAADPVVRIRRLRSVNGSPWLIVDTTLPHGLVPGLAKANLENRSLYQHLRRHYGLKPAGADRWLRAILPTPEEARLLDVSVSTPLLDVESVAWDEHDVPFELYHAVLRSDEFRFFVGIR